MFAFKDGRRGRVWIRPDNSDDFQVNVVVDRVFHKIGVRAFVRPDRAVFRVTVGVQQKFEVEQKDIIVVETGLPAGVLYRFALHGLLEHVFEFASNTHHATIVSIQGFDSPRLKPPLIYERLSISH